MSEMVGPSFNFSLPAELEADAPPEARGIGRDQVRLMVSHYQSREVSHAHFNELPGFLRAGDVVVVNTSGTRNAAVRAVRPDRTELELHLSIQLEGNLWTVEPRAIYADGKSKHFDGIVAGEDLALPSGGSALLQEPYVSGVHIPRGHCGRRRLTCRPRSMSICTVGASRSATTM
jgi:S-adenosylmethionine:tRNA ribosyltransferase-isomerase